MKRLVEVDKYRTKEILRTDATPEEALNYRGQTRFPLYESIDTGEAFVLGKRSDHDVILVEEKQ